MKKVKEKREQMLKLKEAMQIITLAVLQSKGIKIARLAGNRNLDPKIVKAKKKSLKETGLLVPAIIVEASLALEESLEVVDFETGEAVTEETASIISVGNETPESMPVGGLWFDTGVNAEA